MGIFGPPNISEMQRKRDFRGLVKALKYSENSIRHKAADALDYIGQEIPQSAVKPLIDALIYNLNSGDITRVPSYKYYSPTYKQVICCAIISALGSTHDARVVDVLIPVLKDNTNTNIQIAAAKSLGNLGNARAFDQLLSTFNDNIGNERRDLGIAAAESLGKIGDSRALNPLIMRLDSGYVDVRIAVAGAVGKLGDVKQAVNTLIHILANPSFSYQFGREQFDEELNKKREMNRNVKNKLMEFGKSAIKPLTELLDDKSEQVQMAATEVLKELQRIA